MQVAISLVFVRIRIAYGQVGEPISIKVSCCHHSTEASVGSVDSKIVLSERLGLAEYLRTASVQIYRTGLEASEESLLWGGDSKSFVSSSVEVPDDQRFSKVNRIFRRGAVDIGDGGLGGTSTGGYQKRTKGERRGERPRAVGVEKVGRMWNVYRFVFRLRCGEKLSTSVELPPSIFVRTRKASFEQLSLVTLAHESLVRGLAFAGIVDICACCVGLTVFGVVLSIAAANGHIGFRACFGTVVANCFRVAHATYVTVFIAAELPGPAVPHRIGAVAPFLLAGASSE